MLDNINAIQELLLLKNEFIKENAQQKYSPPLMASYKT